MKTCPNCGAENRDTASECRLCAAPLIVPAATAESKTPSSNAEPSKPTADGAVSPPSATPPRAVSPSARPEPGLIFCPSCRAENEEGWAFCQGCGKKLEVGPSPPVKDTAAPSAPIAAPRPSKPDTGKVSRPPATKIDEPAPVPPAEVVEQAPTIRGAMPNQGGPASRKPQADAKPAEMGSPVEVGQAPPGNMPQASAGRVPQPVPVEASSAGTPPLPSPQPAALEPQLSWKTVAACFDCGAVIPPDAHFCAGCGRPIGSRPKKATGGAVIEVVTEGGKIGDVYPIFRGDLIIGRIEGDVTFPHDGYMSSRHARIMERDGQYFLSDESSRNGTFVRIRGEIELKPGDTFLVGKQVLKFDKK